MTNKQYKILKYIHKHDDVKAVCKKFKCDYIQLQEMLPQNALEFKMDFTYVRLSEQMTEAVEWRIRDNKRFLIPVILSIVAIIISVIALLVALSEVLIQLQILPIPPQILPLQ